MRDNYLRIFLNITYLDLFIEVNVSSECNFKMVLDMVSKMKKIQLLDEQYIYEKETMMLCDQDVSLERLGVMNENTFLVI